MTTDNENEEIDSEEEEGRLVIPTDVKKSKRRNPDLEAIEDDYQTEDNSFEKIIESSGKIRINLESGGRFSLPDHLYFEDYSTKDISDITMSRQEDILENLIAVVQRLCCDPSVNIGDATVEEFLEIMLSLKLGFDPDEAAKHVHRWMHECQAERPESERELSEMTIDLGKINYKSIELADISMREYFSKIYPELTEDQINEIKIIEPFTLKQEGLGDYTVRHTRIKDLLEGFKLASRKYAGKIRQAKTQTKSGVPLDEMKAQREEDVSLLEHEKSKDALMISKSLSIIAVKGRKVNVAEKIHEFSSMKRKMLKSYNSFMANIDFGIFDERELKCNLCSQTERGSLQQSFNPLEFVPGDFDTNESASDGKLRERSSVDIYFGVQA